MKKRFVTVSLILIVTFLTFAAPSCSDRLEKASARAARVTVYAETGRSALPQFGPELKLTPEKQARIDSALARARDFARELSVTLDGIRNKAIDEITGKAKARELLVEIVTGIDVLQAEGFFEFPNLKPEVAKYARIAILGLKATVALLQSDLR